MLVGASCLRPFSSHVVSIYWDSEGAVGHIAITDADVEHLHELTHLGQLFLDGTAITDAGMEGIRGLNELDVLYLDGTQLTDVGLALIRDLPQLRFLSLDGTEITGTGLRFIEGVPNLQILYRTTRGSRMMRCRTSSHCRGFKS